jgi:hypothetical protein
MDARVQTPLVFGHEMSGTVDEVGEGVHGWSPGEKVTVMPLVWDGTCAACLAGNQHICQHLEFIGIDSPGALPPSAGAVTPLIWPWSATSRRRRLADPAGYRYQVWRSPPAATRTPSCDVLSKTWIRW